PTPRPGCRGRCPPACPPTSSPTRSWRDRCLLWALCADRTGIRPEPRAFDDLMSETPALFVPVRGRPLDHLGAVRDAPTVRDGEHEAALGIPEQIPRAPRVPLLVPVLLPGEIAGDAGPLDGVGADGGAATALDRQTLPALRVPE